MNTKRFHWVPLLALLAGLGTALPGRGQLSLSPTILEAQAYRGSAGTLTLALANSGAAPLACKVSVSSLAVGDSGMPSAVEDAPRSCRQWLNILPDSFRLERGEGRKILCRLQVPIDAAGGYYATISVDATPEAKTADAPDGRGVRSGIRFRYRNMVVVLITVPGPDVKAVIEAGEPVLTQPETGSGYLLQLPVRNQGTLHARMKGTAEVRSEAGQTIDRYELEAGRGFILPGHERVFPSRSKLNLPDGAFVADVRLEAVGFSNPMRRQFPFTVQDGKVAFGSLSEEQQAALDQRSAGFAISEPYLVAPLRPGAQKVQAIELRNLTKQTIPVVGRVLHWDRRQDGAELVPDDPPEHGRTGVGLVSLRQTALDLRPLSRQRVLLQISLPKEADGEHYAAVVFARADHALPDGPADRPRRSCLITVQAQGGERSLAEIAEVTAHRLPTGIVELAARLRNTGNVSVDPDLSFSLMDVAGSAVGKLAPASRPAPILAGGELVVPMSWEKILTAGEYTVVATLRFSPQQPAVTARTTFTVPESVDASAPADTTRN